MFVLDTFEQFFFIYYLTAPRPIIKRNTAINRRYSLRSVYVWPECLQSFITRVGPLINLFKTGQPKT